MRITRDTGHRFSRTIDLLNPSSRASSKVRPVTNGFPQAATDEIWFTVTEPHREGEQETTVYLDLNDLTAIVAAMRRGSPAQRAILAGKPAPTPQPRGIDHNKLTPDLLPRSEKPPVATSCLLPKLPRRRIRGGRVTETGSGEYAMATMLR